MKIANQLRIACATATMAWCACAAAIEVEVTVYGSLRAGMHHQTTDGYQKVNSSIDIEADGKTLGIVDAIDTVDKLKTKLASVGFTAAQTESFFESLVQSITGNFMVPEFEINDGHIENSFHFEKLFGEEWFSDTGYQWQSTVEDSDQQDGRLGFTQNIAMLDAHQVVGAGVKQKSAKQLQLGHGFGGSRIGIRGVEYLGNGARAGFAWETEIGADGDAADGRLANVWLSGIFGKLTAGQQNNPYRLAANWDQAYWLGGNNRYGDGGTRLQGMRYDGDFGAFRISLMATAEQDESPEARFVNIFADGNPGDDHGDAIAASATVAYPTPRTISGVDSWIAVGQYDLGAATINLGWRENRVDAQPLGESFDNFVISANGAFDEFEWALAHERNRDNTTATRSERPIQPDTLPGSRPIGAIDQAANAAVHAVADALAIAHDTDTIGLFLAYNFSEKHKFYLQWEDSTGEGVDWSGDSLDKTSTLLGYACQLNPHTALIAEYVRIENNSNFQPDSEQLLGFMKVDF